MKQNFKIGKIFLFIVVSVCVFFNCEIGLCNDGPWTPELLDNCGELGSSQVPNLTAEDINEIMQQSGSGQDDEASALKQKVKQGKHYMPGDSQLPSLSSEDIEETRQSDSGQDDEASASKREVEQQDQKNIEDNDGNQQSKQVNLDQGEGTDTSRQGVEQQDQESVEDEDDDQRSEQIKVVTTTEDVYLPIDISNSIFDSTIVAMKNIDNFNVENEYFGIKVGFDYDFRLKKNEENDFNKYIILNPKLLGTDNIYFSIFNYHDFLKNKHTNSEDFKKNYYTLYAKSNIDGINSVYFGASIGYIPFKGVIDDSDKNFKKYMLFASLNTDFSLMLLGSSINFSNLLTLDFNLLRSDYLVNSNKSNEYIKIKDGMLLNYEISGLTGLFVGVDFGVYTMHREFRKNIGLNKNTECNLITGIKFEFGSINVSLGNRGVGLGLSMNY